MSYDPKACGAKCDKCPLFGSVPVPPDVGHSAKICVVGEAPGVDEIREGRPFVGASGLELHRGLTAARILKRDVHLTNVLLCQPPKNELSNLLARISAENREKDKRNKARKKSYDAVVKRDATIPVPLYEEMVMNPIDCCAPRLQAEVNRYSDFITLGGFATRAITGSTQSILSLRGGTIDLVAGRGLPARRVMPTVHPAFVLRAQRWTSVFRGDLFRANRWFTGTMAWTPPTVVYNPSPAWLDTFLNQPGIPYWTYDLETDGIEPLTANLRCVGIGAPDGRVTIVGILSRDGISKFYTERDELRVIEIMKAFFSNPKIVKVGHNSGSYDYTCLHAQWDIEVAPQIDTILLHRLTASELPHSLGFVGSVYTDAPSWKCYDPETEVLTPSGWVRFPDLRAGEPVAQWSSGTVSFVQPTAYVDQAYTGEMWRITSNAADLLVTPDHKMVYKRRTDSTPEVCVVQDLPEGALLPHGESGDTWLPLPVGGRSRVEQYTGRIYCVSVPAGFILVRRNGKVTVSGNTDREGNKIAFSAESDEQLHEYCLFEGTRVVTEEGTKTIEEIVRSKWAGRVLSMSEAGVLELRTVTGWHYSVDKAVEWVRVRFEGERARDVGLICTPDHRLIGPSGEIEAQNLEPGAEIYAAEATLRVASVEPYTPNAAEAASGAATARYCIDVEQNHNFFTTAGLVHNCAMDVRVTSMLLPPLFDSVKTRGQSGLIAADHRVQKICAEMHRVGMWVDQAKRLEYERKYVKEAAFRLEELRRSSPIADFNPGSPHQIRRLLFDDWNLVAPLDEKERYTASGDPATSDDVLRSLLTLSHLSVPQREFIYGLRKYRKAQKLLGTYIVKLRPSTQSADLGWDDEAEPEDYDIADEEALNLRRRAERETREKYGMERTGIVNPRTGRMHPGYNAHVAVTGRLSSSRPINAQNFPKGLRAMVRAAPGHVLIGADADQLELRIAAALWGAKRYLAAFAASADPHSSTALACFGEAFRNAAGFPGGHWLGDLFIPNGEGKWTGEGKTFRDLAKRVQYACCATGTKVVTATAAGSIEIENIKDGTPLWAWSQSRGRYEPTKALGDAKLMGRKRTVRIHLAWGQGNTYRSEMVLTPDHLCMLRDGTWRAAGNLQPGDRLMPFWRYTHSSGNGFSYRFLRPFNDGRRVGEHRIMQGFYEPGEGDTHVHHKDEDTFNNDPENLEPLDYRQHYELYKEDIDAGRRNSQLWRTSVSDSETRRAATQKSWDGGERKAPVFSSKLDAYAEHIGIKPDREVAEMAGCTPENVGHYRKVHTIGKPAGQRGGIREQILVLREKLGVLTDAEIAEMVGCDRANVARLRESMNIPSAPRKKHRSSSLLDAYADRIGHEKDSDIAAAAGCTPENVLHYRKVRGIPAYWRDCLEGTNHVVLGVSDAGEEDVWDIEVDHEDHNFALEAGVFVHNSQYMATVETVHRVICQTETEGKGGKTELPYLALALAEVRKMHQAWMDGCPEFPVGWEREIDEWRRQSFLMEPIDFRRRDFLDGENPNELVNFKIQCVPGHVRVLTRDGYIPIAQLRHKRFEAWTGLRWAPATCISKGRAKLREVRTNHALRLLCDETHRFKVPDRSEYVWKQAKDLIMNQRVAIDLARPLEFGDPVDPEDAFMVGLFLADGCAMLHGDAGSRAIVVSFSVGNTCKTGPESRAGEEAVARIVRWATSRGMNPRAEAQQGCVAVSMAGGAGTWCEVWGLSPGLKARFKRVPELIWRADLAARRAFLQGLLNGDGYQTPDGNVVLSLCNPNMLEDIAILARTVGVDATSMQGPHRTNADTGDGKDFVCWRLHLAGAHTHRELGWGRACKYRSNNTIPQFECLRTVDRLRTTTPSHRTMKSRIRGHRGATSITSYSAVDMGVTDLYDHAVVTSVGEHDFETEVFTLCVDDELHQYVAGGFIAKNSSAAALMNRAIIALADEVPCEKWGRGTGIINQCHDSLVLEVPADGAELITYKDETTGEEKERWVIPEGSIPWRTMHVLNEAMNQVHPALPGVKITAAADIGLTWKDVG